MGTPTNLGNKSFLFSGCGADAAEYPSTKQQATSVMSRFTNENNLLE